MGLCFLIWAGRLEEVIRDYKGDWVIVFIDCAPLTTPLHAELKALLQRLKVAKSLNIKPLHLCSDTMELVIAMVQGHDLYTNIICECRHLLQKLGVAAVKHIFREQNRVADASLVYLLFGHLHLIIPLVEVDKKGTIFARSVKLSNLNLYGWIVAHGSISPPTPSTLNRALAPIIATPFCGI